MPERHVFFSPHADDVVLSCGGRIDSLLSEGRQVEVIGVFAGEPEKFSAYARHLHAKWRLPQSPVAERWREDSEAMSLLGVHTFERWDYLEAPYRTSASDKPLYVTDEELVGTLKQEDWLVRKSVGDRIEQYLERARDCVLYFPLSLGHHVDHQILFENGLTLTAAGTEVRFYEDYPHAEHHHLNGQGDWKSETFPIQLETKLKASCAYSSQVHGLGGSTDALKERLHSFNSAAGNGHVSERYWQLPPESAKRVLRQDRAHRHPLAKQAPAGRLRDFGKFLKTFRWHDLDELLPPGEGVCVDAGCGSGRHRDLINARGYRWLGVDREQTSPEVIVADVTSLPVGEADAAAFVSWQVIEYVEQPEAIIQEAARVLEPGGVFCGSVSFLEPVHGRTYFNLSPLILERLLRKHGFADVSIKPGLNGFALMLWTWLRRTGIPGTDRLALLLASAALTPIAALIFISSWVRQSLKLGGGDKMRWLTETAPLEFAGHVMFCARKKVFKSPLEV